jgi:hypothetical protein
MSAMNAQHILPRFPIVKFRVLIIGRRNAGKTAILQRVCDTTQSPEIIRVGSSRTRYAVRFLPCVSLHLIISPGWTTRIFHKGRACLFLMVTADREAPACASVGSITSRTNWCSQTIPVMFSTTPAGLKPAVQMRLGSCKILFVLSPGRGNWRIDCMRYGLFPRLFNCNFTRFA